MSLLGRLFGRKPRPPEPHRVRSVPGTTDFIVVRQRDEHQVAGPFDNIGEAGACADALSAGASWHYGPDDRAWKERQGYL